MAVAIKVARGQTAWADQLHHHQRGLPLGAPQLVFLTEHSTPTLNLAVALIHTTAEGDPEQPWPSQLASRPHSCPNATLGPSPQP